MTIKINSKLYSRGDSGIVIIYAIHHSGIKPVKSQVTKANHGKVSKRRKLEWHQHHSAYDASHFYPSLPSTKKLKHPSTNQSAFVGAVGSNPTCSGTQEGLAHLCIGKQASRLLPWLGYCRGLWPSVALLDHNPGAAAEQWLDNHPKMKGPLWKPQFPEKFQHSITEKKKKKNLKFGWPGVGKRNSLTLCASPLSHDGTA